MAKHQCAMPVSEGSVTRPGTTWVCTCGRRWTARPFLGAVDDLRWRGTPEEGQE